MKKAIVAAMILLSAAAFTACNGSSSSDNNNVAAVVGSLLLQLNGGQGGDAAGTMGGMGGQLVVAAQAEALIFNSGSATMPTVTFGASPEVIAASVSWTDAMNYGADGQPGVAGVDDDGDTTIDNCNDYAWAGSDDGWYDDGFQVNPGVVITLDTDDLACTEGMYVVAGGPVVMLGTITTVTTNDFEVSVELVSEPDLVSEDGTILINGFINLTGPDNATGSGIDGGVLVVDNAMWDNEDPIFVGGNIWASGGDSTFTNGNGGFGGVVTIDGQQGGDIVVQANIILSGGNADGSGMGGFGGMLLVVNDWSNVDPTALGRIIFYNVNSINVNGGDSDEDGGSAGMVQVISTEAGITVAPPIFGFGGEAGTLTNGVGGNGGMVMFIANADMVESAALIGPADIYELGGIWVDGGDTNSDFIGGSAGIVQMISTEGNVNGAGIIMANGGDGLGVGADGGQGGNVISVASYVTDADPNYMYFSVIAVNGGDGDDIGGSAGVIQLINTNAQGGNAGAFTYLNPASLFALAGEGGNTDGNSGTVIIIGNIQ